MIDIRVRRIPNVADRHRWRASGVGLAASHAAVSRSAPRSLGLLVGLALMMPGHVLGATGAGDVKFMAAVGAIVGPALVVSAFLFTALAGGVLALAVAIRRRRLSATLAGTGRLIAAPGRKPRKEIQSAPDIKPFRLRAGNRDRQRPRGADRMSARCASAEHETSGAIMMKRIRNERGAALLETAITLPLVLLVSVGIFEFGRAYQTWQVLTNAAREGARIAVIPDYTDTQVTTTVQNYMTGGRLANAGRRHDRRHSQRAALALPPRRVSR